MAVGFGGDNGECHMMMRRFCEIKDVKQPYNHHEFQEMIGYALISPETEWTTRNRKKKAPASKTPPPEMNKRAPKVSCNSLHPTDGALKCRLDSTLDHIPRSCPRKSNKSENICQLHRYANKKVTGEDNLPPGSRGGVMYCATCRVNLCLPCYYLFHKSDSVAQECSTILSSK